MSRGDALVGLKHEGNTGFPVYIRLTLINRGRGFNSSFFYVFSKFSDSYNFAFSVLPQTFLSM